MTDDGRLFKPDPAKDRPGQADPTRLISPQILQRLSPRMRELFERCMEQSLTAGTVRPPPRCSLLGCGETGVERHHYLEREIFGRLAELGPIEWLCADHHLLITAIRNASRDRRSSDRR
jgi:hypothetical protein